MARLLLGSGGLSTDARRKAWIAELDDFLGPVRSLLFVPYALADHDRTLEMMARGGFHAGREVRGLHREGDPAGAIARAEALSVGGGNTFRLLDTVQRMGLLPAIRERVLSGVPYVGISAGTVLACPTIQTTNDMPIVWPHAADALGLVPLQVNPHYVPGAFYGREADWYVRYGGETRDDRLREFHEENAVPVLALREGSILRVEGRVARIRGSAGARLFRRGEAALDLAVGDDVSASLSGTG